MQKSMSTVCVSRRTSGLVILNLNSPLESLWLIYSIRLSRPSLFLKNSILFAMLNAFCWPGSKNYLTIFSLRFWSSLTTSGISAVAIIDLEKSKKLFFSMPFSVMIPVPIYCICGTFSIKKAPLIVPTFLDPIIRFSLKAFKLSNFWFD